MDLTDAYENGAYIPGANDYPPRWKTEAAAFRDALAKRAAVDVAYGPGRRQVMDLFQPEAEVQGLVVFIHGGYWRRFDKTYWSHFSNGALARGWAVAMPSYTLAPEARISTITQEVARAVAFAAEQVAGPIVITGHSAGGHLSARMRCRDVELPGDVGERIKRIVPISPLSDLRPLMQTEMNGELKLDMAEAEAESPMLKTDLRDAETVVWVGGSERPAFLDQARWLGEAWRDTRVHVEAGLHHFDVIDGLKDPHSQLMRDICGD